MDNELKEIFDDFEKIQERLKQYLEKQYQIVPLPSPYDPWTPQSPFEPVEPNRCAECGIILEGVMGYYCPRTNCPTGLGGPTCTSTEGKPIC